jgi:hypothetical protein
LKVTKSPALQGRPETSPGNQLDSFDEIRVSQTLPGFLVSCLTSFVPRSTCESSEHIALKRLALLWAQEHGFPIAAAEVSLPSFRFRLDVAAYCPGKALRVPSPAGNRSAPRHCASVGATIVFECKVSRPDYLRHARSVAKTLQDLERYTARKLRLEEVLRIHFPSIRNGDSLFPEYETLNFERPGYEDYQGVLEEIRRLSLQLHAKTKFDKLTKWRAANLHYVVAEPELFRIHELPAGWGLLLRSGETLNPVIRPVFHEVDESQRLTLLHRIALAGTRSVNVANGIPPGFPGIRPPDSRTPKLDSRQGPDCECRR